MTKEEINKILERDMPGWRVAPLATLPQDPSKGFMVQVTNGHLTKVAVIRNGTAVGAHG